MLALYFETCYKGRIEMASSATNCELDRDVRAAFSSTALRVTDTFDFGCSMNFTAA